MEFGSLFVIPNGVTVTFNRGVVADRYQIFKTSGTGIVVFNEEYQVIGYPEWWGAAVGGTNCSTAINACIQACPIKN